MLEGVCSFLNHLEICTNKMVILYNGGGSMTLFIDLAACTNRMVMLYNGGGCMFLLEPQEGYTVIG